MQCVRGGHGLDSFYSSSALAFLLWIELRICIWVLELIEPLSSFCVLVGDMFAFSSNFPSFSVSDCTSDQWWACMYFKLCSIKFAKAYSSPSPLPLLGQSATESSVWVMLLSAADWTGRKGRKWGAQAVLNTLEPITASDQNRKWGENSTYGYQCQIPEWISNPAAEANVKVFGFYFNLEVYQF